MELQTKVALPKEMPNICHNQRLMVLGSCFADHIGGRLSRAKFCVDVNPFGTLYNPYSIMEAICRLGENRPFRADELFEHNDLWRSFMHHSDFAAPTAAESLAHINSRYVQAAENFNRLDWLILTFGTAYIYYHRDTCRVVANCHKLPEKCFDRQLASVDEIVTSYTRLINDLLKGNRQLKLLFTVSPIRHIRDGLHANQLSKARLLLAIEELQQRFPGVVHYFPAYEICIDELRDYRFYAADMVHPTEVAVNYIWEAFGTTFFDKKTRHALGLVEEINRNLSHKPFHPEGEGFHRFIEATLDKITHCQAQYPAIDFSREIELCHTILTK